MLRHEGSHVFRDLRCGEFFEEEFLVGLGGGRSRWPCRVILASANSSERFSGVLIQLFRLKWQIVHTWLPRELEPLETKVRRRFHERNLNEAGFPGRGVRPDIFSFTSLPVIQPWGPFCASPTISCPASSCDDYGPEILLPGKYLSCSRIFLCTAQG